LQQLSITDFTAWHQVFIGLNLAYAGSKDFRIYITEISDKVKNLVVLSLSIHTKIYDYLLARIESKNNQWKNKFQKTKATFENSEKFIHFNSIVEKDFTNIFKPFFFISSLSGLVFLFLSGIISKIDPELLLKCVYLSNFSLISYGLIIFIYSFIRNEIDKPINVFVNIFILICVIFFGVKSIDFAINQYKSISFGELSFLELNTIFSPFSVAMPLFLFFFRKLLQFFLSALYLANILIYGCFVLVQIRFVVSLDRTVKTISDKLDNWFSK